MTDDGQAAKPQAALHTLNWALEQPTPQELRLLCAGREMATMTGHMGIVIAAKFYTALKEHGQSGADMYAEGVYDGLTQGLASERHPATEQPPPTA